MSCAYRAHNFFYLCIKIVNCLVLAAGQKGEWPHSTITIAAAIQITDPVLHKAPSQLR